MEIFPAVASMVVVVVAVVGVYFAFYQQPSTPVLSSPNPLTSVEAEYQARTVKEQAEVATLFLPVDDATQVKVIDIARRYIIQRPSLFLDNKPGIAWDDEKVIGTKLDPTWIVSKQPTVQHPKSGAWPAPHDYINDKYLVNWFFIPGCEESPTFHGSPNWVDRLGHQCLGGYGLSVIINANDQAERVDLHTIN